MNFIEINIVHIVFILLVDKFISQKQSSHRIFHTSYEIDRLRFLNSKLINNAILCYSAKMLFMTIIESTIKWLRQG